MFSIIKSTLTAIVRSVRSLFESLEEATRPVHRRLIQERVITGSPRGKIPPRKSISRQRAIAQLEIHNPEGYAAELLMDVLRDPSRYVFTKKEHDELIEGSKDPQFTKRRGQTPPRKSAFTNADEENNVAPQASSTERRVTRSSSRKVH